MTDARTATKTAARIRGGAATLGGAAMLLLGVPAGAAPPRPPVILVPPAPQAPPVPPAPVIPSAPPSMPITAESRASARAVAAQLFPDGTYRRIMDGTLQKMIDPMMDGMGNLPMAEFAKIAGATPADVAALDKATIAQVAAIVDPHYRERMRLTMDAMFKGMIPLFESMEPELRAGLADSLATRFSGAQLGELHRFFTTPTGAAYASQQWLLFTDPAVMGRMQTQLPKLLQQMPELMRAAQQATAALPKPRTYEQLTPDERSRLAKLLGKPAR